MNRKKLLALLLSFGPSVLVHAQTKPNPAVPMSSEGRLYSVMTNNTVAVTPSDDELDRQIARVYRDFAHYLETDPAKEYPKADAAMRGLLTEITRLLREPGVTDLVHFRDVYRTILRESKELYGKVDSSFVAENDDVFEIRAQAIAELQTSEEANLLENASSPLQTGLAKPNTIFPMELENPVLRAMASLGRQRDHFQKVRTRADMYFPMIERIMQEEGVPEELKYLAIVESALNPRAQSWAAAVGLWQFIPATGAGYGLDISRSVDERRDPEKATRAAARHLKDLSQMFGGDWQLALAGYNCNPYRVKRVWEAATARKGRPAKFWDIMNELPRETRNYVPLFIATYYIMNNQEAFNLGTYAQAPTYEYDAIMVQGGTDLDAVAERVGVQTSLIRALNPELRTDTTPSEMASSFRPDKALLTQLDNVTSGGYLLRVPKGTGERLGELALSSPASISYGSRQGNMAVRSGNALNNLASILPSSRDRSKPKPKPTPVVTPVVPEVTSDSTNVAAESADPKVTARPKTTTARPRPENTERLVSAPSGKRHVVKVKSGQTLTQLAQEYGVEASEIKEWNSLKYNQINTGQRLVIFSDKATESARTAPPKRETSTRSRSARETAAPTTHRVQSGETLASVARKNNMTVRELKEINGIKGDVVRKGDIIRLKGSAKASTKNTKTSAKSSTKNTKKKEAPKATKKTTKKRR